MATEAQITSLDALGAFRSELIGFRATATRALDEVFGEVNRTRQWVRGDRRVHWQGELRRRQKALDQALQELMGARLSDLKATSAPQQAAVTKARRALREAEEKLRLIKAWERNYDLLADPMVKRLGGLHGLLDHDLPKAIAALANLQRALDAYAERLGTRETPPPPAAAETPFNAQT